MNQLTTEWYQKLRETIISLGYAREIEWAQSIQPVSNDLDFWTEYAWVVLNSGMKNQIAQKIWNKVRPAVLGGKSASSVFGHKGKAMAIDGVYAKRAQWFNEYLKAEDKLAFLEAMPWIGGITKYHLAKNYGMDCAKPDRHLVRISSTEGTFALCSRLAQATGDRIGTVDLVIWRAANLGLA